MNSPGIDSKRTSDVLKDIVLVGGQDEIAIGEFMTMLGDRSFALAILIFSLPNSLPIPGIPGFSTVTGIPILFIAIQIVCGRKAIWLPRSVALKQFPRHFLVKMITKALPVIVWLEKFLHPRLTVVCGAYGERIIGVLIAVMAFILALPIPGGNIPPGVSISLLALAILERDGVFALVSMVFTVASFCFIYKLIALVLGSAMDWM
jgi:hypothetical protein